MYEYAINKLKLGRAIEFVEKKISSGIVIEDKEKAIKEQYIALKGLVVESGEDIKEVVSKIKETVRVRPRKK
jgi:hypothetical protein